MQPVTLVSSLLPASTPSYEQVPSTPAIVKVPFGPKSATDFTLSVVWPLSSCWPPSTVVVAGTALVIWK